MTLLDQDIREPLFDFLEGEYGKIRILEEKQIGRSRADIVMVSDEGIYGIEIKSDADSYARLKRQVRDYNRFYDYNIIAVGTRHAFHVHEHVPWWWGIITVELYDGKVDFYYARRPERNPERSMEDQLTMLWRPELVKIQEAFALPAYREKSKAFVQQKILEKLPEELVEKEIRRLLFERDYTMIEQEINSFRKSKGKRKKRRTKAGIGHTHQFETP